jgi:XTP/dITP diphosphohydrolase
MRRIIFATHNQGKIQEIREILKGLDVLVVSADEAGVHEDVVEDGKTFEDNALKKAEFVGRTSNEWAMGDDSGICVEALDGAPGIYSARWAGEGAPGHKWVELLFSKLEGVPEGKRGAWFETVAVLRSPTGQHWAFSGRVNGTIAVEPRGISHPRLPYDSVFIPEGETRTFAEMTKEEKNAISHRGRAFRKLRDFIQDHQT